MKYVIWFESLKVDNNVGYFFRNRKVGFTGVYQQERARHFKVLSEAERVLAILKEKEGKYYNFEIREVK